MEYFAERGFDTWCIDIEGYGRSTKDRGTEAFIAEGADDLAAGSEYISEDPQQRPAAGLRHLVGRAARRAVRPAPPRAREAPRARRLCLDRRRQSPTLASASKKLPEYLKTKRRPIDRAFVRSIFERDHPGTADDRSIEAFADAILELDNSIPNGTYIDMCNNLPVVDPAKITVPTIIMRGEYDGIAGFDDLIEVLRARCRTRTSSSPSCPASRTRACSRRTT